MNEYVVLVAGDREYRKSIHRHIVEAKTFREAATVGADMCSHGLNVETVIEVFKEPGLFFQYGLETFDFPSKGPE